MTTLIQRRSVLQTGVAGLTGLAAAGLRPARAQEGKKLRIALSNSYIGNKWRIEMENVFKAALQMEPYKSEVEGTWFNSGNDVSKQSQQTVEPDRANASTRSSSTPPRRPALNGIIAQATARGILMVVLRQHGDRRRRR